MFERRESLDQAYSPLSVASQLRNLTRSEWRLRRRDVPSERRWRRRRREDSGCLLFEHLLVMRVVGVSLVKAEMVTSSSSD